MGGGELEIPKAVFCDASGDIALSLQIRGLLLSKGYTPVAFNGLRAWTEPVTSLDQDFSDAFDMASVVIFRLVDESTGLDWLDRMLGWHRAGALFVYVESDDADFASQVETKCGLPINVVTDPQALVAAIESHVPSP